jgi:hypothetical protein
MHIDELKEKRFLPFVLNPSFIPLNLFLFFCNFLSQGLGSKFCNG